MSEWPRGFAYRIDVGGLVFLEAAVGVTLITVLMIGYQSIRAALANPERTLRSE